MRDSDDSVDLMVLLFVGFKPFAETHDIIGLEPNALVEFNHRSIRAAHLQVDLRAAYFPKTALGFIHHTLGNPSALVLWMNRKIVDPATMAIVSGHDAGNDLAVRTRDKEHFRLHVELPLYVAMGIVPGNDQAAVVPQLDYGLLITWLKRSDFHIHHL